MNQVDHSEQENKPVQKALNTLPKVNAAGDFEQRLQRRLTQEEPKPAFSEKIFQSRFVPAFAYSFMALIAVGVVSYYVFIRTGADSTAMAPVNTLNQPAESVNATAVQQQQDQSVNDKPSVVSRDKQEKATDVKEGKRNEDNMESFAKQAGKKDADQEEVEIDETQQIQSVQSGGTGTADQVNQQQEEAKARQVPSIQQAEKSTIPTMNVPGFQSQSVMSAQQISRIDSLRKDSLQKVQQKMLQEKSGIKKPL